MQQQENTQTSYGLWQSSEPHSLSSIIPAAFYDHFMKASDRARNKQNHLLRSIVAVLYVSWRLKDAEFFLSFLNVKTFVRQKETNVIRMQWRNKRA